MPQYINLAIVILALIVVYGSLNRFSPILVSGKETLLDFNQLKAKYGKLNRLIIAGIIICTFALTFIVNWTLELLLTFRLGLLYDVLYIVPPDFRVILFDSFCISFLFSGLIFWRIAYYSTLTEWEEYLEFVNMYFRFDAVRFTKRFNRVLSLFVALLTMMVFDWYTTFGDEEIKANDLLGLGTRKYEYNNIVEVKDVKKRANLLGDIIDKPFCVMTFKDEYKWKNAFMSNGDNEKILQLVLARTNVFKTDVELESE
ncbi:MAG: hypothetical protein V4658_01305 [Bacteroidota bacterium]